ncbi:hypothetical protein JRO89_XS10G0161900 [Xanthoceras sorbifolium]|uniref:Retrovirus-related Pol polyprotein from transposon TNT 1-94-like beta-barrel domain-containing protein n=1 Tax=Xanthoceras sorbifolium TaxID=99658 RepID=A0ABQ8HIZ6_9ROSI|nr:hypothetical protein JRO89_XS10G0161900 [Xanthoceras sorbifolium]
MAIKYRQLEIFKLVKNMEAPMRRLVRKLDNTGNTILHMTGIKRKDNVPERMDGPALVLQDELLWFKSQELWDLVENGYADPGEEQTLRENKKDSKALFFILQSVYNTVFSRITAATTSRQAWIILQNEYQDIGYSNHTSSIKSTFKELDESYKVQVRLGDNKQIQVEGKGMVTGKTGNNGVKFLHNVFFIPSLAHNLLSVGQLITVGYSVLFDNGTCVIKEKKSGKTIVNVYMMENKMFSLDVLHTDNHAVVVEKTNDNSL